MDIGRILHGLVAIVTGHWAMTLWAAGMIIAAIWRSRRRHLPTTPAGVVEDEPMTWQTAKARSLDDPEFLNSTVRALNGAVPGTNGPYDAPEVADELVQILSAELREQSGVHPETVMTALGALAGFAVQMALRETFGEAGKDGGRRDLREARDERRQFQQPPDRYWSGHRRHSSWG